MRHVFVFLIFLSFLAIKNVLSQGTSSNNVTLTMHIKEGFKPSFNDPLSSDYANLTQRIKNFVILFLYLSYHNVFRFKKNHN